MPRKKPASYRPTVHNLGSPQGGLLDFGREETYARMNLSLGRKAAALPVYLVNPAQMDRLYYPPERRRTFCDPERVGRTLRDLRSRGEEGEEDRSLLWEALRDGSECEPFRCTVAVGLYMGSLDGVSKESVLGLGDPGHQDPGAPPAFQADPGPAIFLCPERIVNRGAQEGVPTALVQDKVYYHELAHALMDTAVPPRTPTGNPGGWWWRRAWPTGWPRAASRAPRPWPSTASSRASPRNTWGTKRSPGSSFSLPTAYGTPFCGKTSRGLYGGATGRPFSLFLSRKRGAWPD